MSFECGDSVCEDAWCPHNCGMSEVRVLDPVSVPGGCVELGG